MEGGPAAERGELLTVLSLDGDWDHEAILGPIFLWPGCRIQLGILLASMYLAEEKRGKCFHAVSLKESSRWEQRLFVVPLDFPGRRGLLLFIHNTEFQPLRTWRSNRCFIRVLQGENFVCTCC